MYLSDPSIVAETIESIEFHLSALIKANELEFQADTLVTLDNFIQERIDKRAKNINWPKSLSKKEVVVCKLSYVKYLISITNLKDPGSTSSTLETWFKSFKPAYIAICNAASSHILATKSKNPDGSYNRFAGLEAPLAAHLNVINKHLIPAYELSIKEKRANNLNVTID